MTPDAAPDLGLFSPVLPSFEGTSKDYVATPAWFAIAFIERYLPDLDGDDIILEPSCGTGEMLRAIPSGVNAYGIEIDGRLAAEARATTGREVITGDALTVPWPHAPTRLVSNVPFRLAFLEGLLDRAYRVLPESERSSVTALIPMFFLQTSSRVARLAERWSMNVETIPRDIFPGLHLPLGVAQFIRNRERRLIGIAFFNEVADERRFPEEFREILRRSRRNVWVDACRRALEILGGSGTVEQITRVISGQRPTRTEYWRQAIRKALSTTFPSSERGRYHLPIAA